MANSTGLVEDGTNYFEEARRGILNKSILLSEDWLIPTIMGCYLIFIFFGNRIMEKQKPFHLKFPMLAFNIFQISYNLYMLYRCIDSELVSYYTRHICHPMDASKNKTWDKGFKLAYLFTVSKHFDLIDTVFLVLRKKTEQISFLHLYHHISVVIIASALLKFFAVNGEQIYVVVVLNSSIHVIMYMYYLLSLLGTSIRKYLWWKKYVTVLQLIQFAIYIGYMLALLAFGCTQPKTISYLLLFQGLMFFVLFRNFFREHYKHSSSSALESTALSGNKKNL